MCKENWRFYELDDIDSYTMAAVDMIWGILLSLLAVVILSANAYVFFVIYKCRSLRTRSNAFLLSLAFSDFAIALFNVPFTAASTFSPRLRTSGTTLCDISGSLEMTFLIASVFSVTAMNFHRFVHIVYWQKYYDLFSVRKVCCLIISIWTMAILLSVPPLLGLSKISYKQGKSHCFVDWKETPGYTFTLMTTCFFIPLSLMGYFYKRIYQHRKQSKKELKYMSEQLDVANAVKGGSGQIKFTQVSQDIGNATVIKGAGRICKDGVKSNIVSSRITNDVLSDKETRNRLINYGYANYDQRGCTPVAYVKDEKVSIVAGANVEKIAECCAASKEMSLDSNGEEFAVIWDRLRRTLGTGVRDAEKGKEKFQIGVEQSKKICETPSLPQPDSGSNVKNLIDQMPTMSSKRKYITAALRAEREERKLTIMCTVIVAVFCISWLPFVVTMCLESLSDVRISECVDRGTLVIGYMNSLANPMIYFYFNRSFRRRFRILNQQRS